MDYTENTPAEEIGEFIARVYRWDGEKIFAALLAAMTEANFHTEAAALIRAWHQPQLTEAAPRFLTRCNNSPKQQPTTKQTHPQHLKPLAPP